MQTMNNRRHSSQGFTLLEIAIVMVIIGFLLVGIMNSQSVMRNARTKDIIKTVNEFSVAAQQFHARYGNWPGALQNATALIPNLSATCVGNATGIIVTAAESVCASEELIRSSMLRGDVDNLPIRVNGNVSLSLTGIALSGVVGLPANWRNLLRIQDINCDVALQLDRATDDGNLTTGNFRSSTACPGQDENVDVPNAVLRLN